MGAQAQELTIDNILSHGNRGAANGTMTFKGLKVEFCDVCVFTSHASDAKIKKLISYVFDSPI